MEDRPDPQSLFDLSGRTAIVTGASSGLGARFVKVLVAAGANVVASARRLDRLEKLAAELGPAVLPVTADVAADEDCQRLVETASDRFGRIDVLVNNAGRLFDSNVFGLVDVTRAVLPAMRRASSGHIVNVLSGVPSRRAVEGFSAALAEELGPLGIEVITIEPGSANGHQPDDPAAAVEAIIAAVDAGGRNRKSANKQEVTR
jgi:NADP-dependent 3-hydroxy acid dehydrogenase YdfG